MDFERAARVHGIRASPWQVHVQVNVNGSDWRCD
jgi:hypothetical protein